MCRLRNKVMRDYQESVTTGQTHTQTDRCGTKWPLCARCFADDTKIYSQLQPCPWKLVACFPCHICYTIYTHSFTPVLGNLSFVFHVTFVIQYILTASPLSLETCRLFSMSHLLYILTASPLSLETCRLFSMSHLLYNIYSQLHPCPWKLVACFPCHICYIYSQLHPCPWKLVSFSMSHLLYNIYSQLHPCPWKLVACFPCHICYTIYTHSFTPYPWKLVACFPCHICYTIYTHSFTPVLGNLWLVFHVTFVIQYILTASPLSLETCRLFSMSHLLYNIYSQLHPLSLETCRLFSMSHLLYNIYSQLHSCPWKLVACFPCHICYTIYTHSFTSVLGNLSLVFHVTFVIQYILTASPSNPDRRPYAIENFSENWYCTPFTACNSKTTVCIVIKVTWLKRE